ncbi:unnamed protein product [Urochloa humidicola]
MRKPAAAPVPKDVAPTPPRPFTDDSYFFNGSSSDDFFSSPGPSSQPWNHQSADPATWGTNASPPGGFTNLIQPQMSQNFIFGGEPSQYASFRKPVAVEKGFLTPISTKDREDTSYVNVESGKEAPRTENRIFWTQEEDVRMVSLFAISFRYGLLAALIENAS